MQNRITVFDTIRGFTMLSMAGFHACYDLAYLYGWDMPWFTQTIFQVRATGAEVVATHWLRMGLPGSV